MAQGNITKKDKVNIPDWVTTNSYLVNDFVINDNKFYRANGAIPAGTGLTIGTTNATWTEMSPSAAATAVPYAYGEWSMALEFDVPALTGGTDFLVPFDTVITETNTTFDANLSMFGLTGDSDNVGFVDIRFTEDLRSTLSGTINTITVVTTTVVQTDDQGTSWQLIPGRNTLKNHAEKNANQTFINNHSSRIPHLPGRKYAIWQSFSSTHHSIAGGTGSKTWNVNGVDHVSTNHHTYISICTSA